MSAILKPLIHAVNTISGTSDPVNIEHVAAITRITVEPAQNINTSGEYSIVFKFRGENTTPSEIKWMYVDAATRDTDYAAILVLASAVV